MNLDLDQDQLTAKSICNYLVIRCSKTRTALLNLEQSDIFKPIEIVSGIAAKFKV